MRGEEEEVLFAAADCVTRLHWVPNAFQCLWCDAKSDKRVAGLVKDPKRGRNYATSTTSSGRFVVRVFLFPR